MRSNYPILTVLALTLTYTETKPDAIRSVNIIRRFTQDLQASPSGYAYHLRSDSVHPGGYNADVNHGNAKISGQIGAGKLEEMKMNGQSGTYKVAGGYGYVISHDYGSRSSHGEHPHPDVHSGASNAVPERIAVLQLDSVDSGGPIIVGDRNGGMVLPVKSQELDSYIGKETYESFMEYDKLVKDGEKPPSVSPGEYYGSDVRDEYQSDDGYAGSNNDRDEGRYVESKKYDGSEDYKENESDATVDGQIGEYVYPAEYGLYDASNGRESAELYQAYDDNENDKYENYYEPLKINDELYESNAHYGPSSESYVAPNIGEFEQSFLKDFFKEFNQFSEGANIQAGYNFGDNGYSKNHAYDDAHHGDHGSQKKGSFFGEDGGSDKSFFDDADSAGYHHEKSDGEKNSKFGEKKGHKKGSKTTGYRNVLHKDEYTKDHTFYANAKNKGFFDKGGDFGEHNSEHDRGYEKGDHRHSHSDDSHHGKKNKEDKGYFVHDDIGHHYENGDDTYHDDNTDYSDEGDGYHDYEYGYDHPHTESDY